MSWLTQFKLGRPGNEYDFDVNPEAMEIQEQAVVSLQSNLAGDLKKSVFKASAPLIRVNSSYLTLAQRNQFASLVGVSDTFLSFLTRDDWEVVNELATIIDATHIKIANSSATRLSKLLVELGGSSIITIETPFNTASGGAYGDGAFGAGPYGGGTFDPGVVTYDDATRIITMTNPVDPDAALYVSYLYTGWLVNLQNLGARAQGGWLDRFEYDFSLEGA